MVRAKALIAILLLFSLIPASFAQDISAIDARIRAFTDDYASVSIIEGKYASKTERIFFATIKDQYPAVANAPYSREEDEKSISAEPARVFIIIGGPTQSPLAKSFLDASDATVEREDIPLGAILFVTMPAQKVVIFSDNAGFANLPRAGIEKSPLANFLPLELVPVAAAGIGLAFFTLWRLFLELSNKIGRSWLASKIMKFVRKKTIKPTFKGFHVRGVRVKLREALAIFVSSAIFALAVSFAFFSDKQTTLTLLALNAVIFIILNIVRNAARLIFDKLHRIHTEYMLWFYGAAITVLSGWLGAVFGVAGYTVTEEGSGKNEGRVDFWVNAATFLLFAIAGIANLLWPSVVLQMTASLALAVAFLQLLPFAPFAGRRIFAYSQAKWWLLFIPLTGFYVATFLIL